MKNNAAPRVTGPAVTIDTKIRTYFQTSAPVGGLTSGDLRVDTSDKRRRIHLYNGSAWVCVSDA